jgi:adenine/guanine phosphoribosyltransferase-like PRPP-binding protein
MKLKSIVWRSLVGVACMGFMLATAAAGEKKVVKSGPKVYKNQVVLVELTGSRIPQHVTIHGQNANSASPVYVVQNDELHRTGASTVGGMLALDPSITIRHGPH